MFFRYTALLCCYFFLLSTLHAQKPPLKWGKVDFEDLQMEVYSKDSTAAAVVLADYATIRFDFAQGLRYIYEHHRRIKILDKAAFDKGEVSIYLYGDEKLTVLKALGVESYPVMLSTRSHGKMIQLYPILRQFNHTVVIARLNEQLLVLDLSNDERPAGVPRKASLNRVGWLVDAEKPQWINIAPPGASTARMFQMDLSPNGGLSYTMQAKREGYHAVDIRTQTKGSKGKTAVAARLLDRYPESSTEGVSITLPENPVDAVKTSYSAEVPEAAQAFNDFLYFAPCILPHFEENPFKSAERAYPVDLAHPIDVRDVFIINVPAGYVLEELPESVSLALPGQAGSFEFTLTQTSGRINLVYSLKLDKTHFEPSEYPALKKLLDLVIEKQSEQLVFRKKA